MCWTRPELEGFLIGCQFPSVLGKDHEYMWTTKGWTGCGKVWLEDGRSASATKYCLAFNLLVVIEHRRPRHHRESGELMKCKSMNNIYR